MSQKWGFTMTCKFWLYNKSGLKLECGIDRNESLNKQPLVFIAGGFGSDAFTGSTQPPLADLFMRHGFAVFRMNFRGNGNSEGDLAFATIMAGLEDTQAAFDYIKTLDWPDSVALCGNSYGGGLAMHEAAERKQFDYKFLILLSPRTDTAWRYEDDKNIDLQDWARKEFITVHGQRRHYSLYSDSLNYHPWQVAGNIKIPTLIIHGDCDEVCPYDLSVKLHELIKTSELETLPGCGHQYKERLGEVVDIVGNWLNKQGIAAPELIDIFDESWNPTGEILERNEAERQGKWHKACHIWIVNPRGELLLQLRSPNKSSYPNMWDISAAGHVRAGETMIEGGIREMKEELGIDISGDQLIPITKRNSASNKHLHAVFLIKLDLPITAFTFSDREVAKVKYMPWREVAKMSREDMLVNSILPHKELETLFEYLEKHTF
ncbi:MAG: alpha/beta fold hydrolase [Rickettsiales bacterium]|nr:alpha/beta fold hydrolase [Rickettsiales bacterium]